MDVLLRSSSEKLLLLVVGVASNLLDSVGDIMLLLRVVVLLL